MSIIVGFAGSSGGVVATDGRICAGNSIVSDSFDKTFELDRGRIIGAFCGLTHFCGKSVAEHIYEFAAGRSFNGSVSLSGVADEIAQHLVPPLQNETNVSFACKKLEFILVGGPNTVESGFCISVREIIPKSGGWETRPTLIRAGNGFVFSTYGHDAACPAARSVLQVIPDRIIPDTFLQDHATRAIRAGIAEAEAQSIGNACGCGGEIFVRHVK